MIHYVKEAQEEALKTVERFTAKKIHCLNFLRALQTCEGLIRYCKLLTSGTFYILFLFIEGLLKKINEKDENVLYNRKSYDLVRSEIIMIFKVYYQESIKQVPVRENTKTLFIEGESVRDVRSKIADRGFNVEFVREVKGAYLEYEQQNEDYKVLEIG
jgi:DNA-dependent RNA polymerase auxiliary subunit epsilon